MATAENDSTTVDIDDEQQEDAMFESIAEIEQKAQHLTSDLLDLQG